ncbi:MAG: inorganic diphosphatase [Candidatus Aenigmatarchaeota archaeon]|nr:MAG: inorganic diphosphatase [Candidatus Aenigmarchaeota archaeon]
MDLWSALEPGRAVPKIVTVVVVTPKDSANVYAYHHHTDIFALAHVIHTPYKPPGDLGFVPRTYTEGNAPLDVIVLSAAPNARRTLVDCRPVALLRMTLDGVRDDAIVCVPDKDPRMARIKDLSDIEQHQLQEIQTFYESLFREQERVAQVDAWMGAKDAIRAIEHAIALYKRKLGAENKV